MTHRHGVEAEPVHAFAWDVLQQTTALAKGELTLDARRGSVAEQALETDVEAFLAGDGGTRLDRRRAREALRLIADDRR
jgi:fructose 1,6-bisphosphatase